MSATKMPNAVIVPIGDENPILSEEKTEKRKMELLNYWKCVHKKHDLLRQMTDIQCVFYSWKVATGDEKAPKRVLEKDELFLRTQAVIIRLVETEQFCDGKKGHWSNGFLGSRWFDYDDRKNGLTVRISFEKRGNDRPKNEKAYCLTFTWEELPYKMCANTDCEVYSNRMKKCSVCESTRYCSTECQKKHWKEHKKVCEKPEEESEDDE
tara:strand:- start:225 stop:851 length:627 start_codon:yes stop_codon:yes gene_type:complete